MNLSFAAILLLLQSVPPRALVFAMALSYALCFAGMLFAYAAYRRRKRTEKQQKKEHP